jgi:hypothetical protein
VGGLVWVTAPQARMWVPFSHAPLSSEHHHAAIQVVTGDGALEAYPFGPFVTRATPAS